MKKIYKALLNNVNEGVESIVLTYLRFDSERAGKIEKKLLLSLEDIEKNSLNMPDALLDGINLSLNTGKVETISIEDNLKVLIEPVVPEPRLIIFGGGHIGKPLCEFASRVGFSVVLIDDRPFFANANRFPDAREVICESFEKSFDRIKLTKSDFVVIVTRGHKHDGLVLRKVLNYDLPYVGMIGSKRRVRGMMEELKGEGYSEDKLNSVNAPIGLSIGAITPDEIAISIVSQLISYKNKGVITKFGRSFSFPEFDRDVAEKIFDDSPIPSANLTILSSKGSVPRKSGAKMISYYDGTSIGSIGGGCSEAGVITKAREIMTEEKGQFIIEHVDMTGEVAESEGMVCGGTMEVLIEVI